MFHISFLRKSIGYPVSIIPLQGERIYESISYEEVPVESLDRQVKRLRNTEVDSVEVLWRYHLVKGVIWEDKEEIKSAYPHLFPYTPIKA